MKSNNLQARTEELDRRKGESLDEAYVRHQLARRFGVSLRKIPESPESKTPDFELIHDQRREAVLEVKTIELTPRTKDNGFRIEHGLTTGKDNAPGRVGTLIHKAWKQLQRCPEPKVLVLVNDERLADIADLEEAYNGFLYYGTNRIGYYNRSSRRIAEGRIKEEKRRIDLYVWFDRHYGSSTPVSSFVEGKGVVYERRTESPFFRCTTARGQGSVRVNDFETEAA